MLRPIVTTDSGDHDYVGMMTNASARSAAFNLGSFAVAVWAGTRSWSIAKVGRAVTSPLHGYGYLSAAIYISPHYYPSVAGRK